MKSGSKAPAGPWSELSMVEIGLPGVFGLELTYPARTKHQLTPDEFEAILHLARHAPELLEAVYYGAKAMCGCAGYDMLQAIQQHAGVLAKRQEAGVIPPPKNTVAFTGAEGGING